MRWTASFVFCRSARRDQTSEPVVIRLFCSACCGRCAVWSPARPLARGCRFSSRSKKTGGACRAACVCGCVRGPSCIRLRAQFLGGCGGAQAQAHTHTHPEARALRHPPCSAARLCAETLVRFHRARSDPFIHHGRLPRWARQGGIFHFYSDQAQGEVERVAATHAGL